MKTDQCTNAEEMGLGCSVLRKSNAQDVHRYRSQRKLTVGCKPSPTSCKALAWLEPLVVVVTSVDEAAFSLGCTTVVDSCFSFMPIGSLVSDLR